MSSTRRGFLKLLGAAAAVPVLAQVGTAPVAAAAELVLPAGSVIEQLTTATSIDDAVGKSYAPYGVPEALGEDEWLWRERYRQRVQDQIEADAYRAITFMLDSRAYAGRSLARMAVEVDATYELTGPIVARRGMRWSIDGDALMESTYLPRRHGPIEQARELGSLHRGVAHVVADQVAERVRQDVLAQLLTLRQEYAR